MAGNLSIATIAVPRPIVRGLVRVALRPTLSPAVPVRTQRRLLDVLGRVSILPRDTIVSEVWLGHRPAERIEVPGSDSSRSVLYLHGGGYTVGSRTTHRALAAHLAAAAGATVFVLDYRLAPEDPFPAALEDAVDAYDDALLASGSRPEQLALAGDSAGGGLAIALALRIRDTGRPQPAALALASPWTDLTLADVADDRRDPMLTVDWLRSCAVRYAGVDRALPEVSPLRADLNGLPPMVVHGSADEILLPSIERFVERARSAGVRARYRRLPDLWHVAHLHAGLMTAATDAVGDLGEFLRQQ